MYFVGRRSINVDVSTFGDVMTFDITYRINRYLMPFVLFIGVNYHYHSILFGFTLLKDETEDTFA